MTTVTTTAGTEDGENGDGDDDGAAGHDAVEEEEHGNDKIPNPKNPKALQP